MPKKPYADTPLAKYIEKRVMELKPRKSQIEIAVEAEFVSVNMLSMLKGGSSKLPLDRVPSLARALECDPAYLLRLTLEQVEGDRQRRYNRVAGQASARIRCWFPLRAGP